jgi:hypothetical protein
VSRKVTYPPLVEVEWTDVTGIPAWLDVDDLAAFAKDGGFVCRNVGYLVHEDEDCIVLAGRLALEADPQQVGMYERLPKTIITGRREIRGQSSHPLQGGTEP